MAGADCKMPAGQRPTGLPGRDTYESTTDALGALYDKVSVGGFVIVDD